MHEHGTKTTPVCSHADGEASWSLPPSSVSLLSDGTVQPENRKYPQGDRSGLRKPKKGLVSTLITAITSVHLPKPVSTNLTITSDSVLTNPIGKEGLQNWWM